MSDLHDDVNGATADASATTPDQQRRASLAVCSVLDATSAAEVLSMLGLITDRSNPTISEGEK